MPLRLFYGGTFDPVHNAHLAIARAAADALAVPVAMMPAADPPHRAAPGASAEQRARMLALAIAGDSRLQLDLRELERARRQPGRPSWTVDTLRELRASCGPAQPLALLIGGDSLAGLGTWHEWEALFDLAHLVVVARPGSALEQGQDPVLERRLAPAWTTDPRDLQAAPGGRVWRLPQPLRAESATAVRAAIAAGGNWRAQVPAAVAAFIVEHGLYGAA